MKRHDQSLVLAAQWASILPLAVGLIVLGYIQVTFALENWDIYLPRPRRLAFQMILYSSGVLAFIGIILAGVTSVQGRKYRLRMALPACLGVIILVTLSCYLFPLLEVAFPARMRIGSWSNPAADLTRAMQRGDLRLIILTNHLGEEWPGVSPSATESHWRKHGLKIIAGEFWQYPEGKEQDSFYRRALIYAEEYNTKLLEEMGSQTTR